MIDDLKAIAIFAETIRQGSFRGAGKALDLSPSVVSYHVSALEERLGQALIYRSTRRLSLTSEGEELYNYALQMLEAAETGLENITAKTAAARGKINLSVASVLTHAPLNEKIARFSQLHSGIEFHISYTDERQDIIAEGIDLAIRIGDMKDSSLKARRIGGLERVLCCSPEYAAQQDQISSFSDLQSSSDLQNSLDVQSSLEVEEGSSNLPVVRAPSDLEGWRWIKLEMLPHKRFLTHKNGRSEEVMMKGNMHVNNVNAMLQHCLHGLGLCTPPRCLAEEALAQGDLVEILPDWTVDDIPIYAVWPANVTEGSNVKKLINYLCD